MGFFDNVRKQAEKAVDQHGDKISKGIDKAAAAASKKTGGKHDDKIAKGVSSTKNALDKLDGRNDDIADGPATPPAKPASSADHTAQDATRRAASSPRGTPRRTAPRRRSPAPPGTAVVRHRRAGEHLPRRPAGDEQLVGQAGVERQQRVRVTGASAASPRRRTARRAGRGSRGP